MFITLYGINNIGKSTQAKRLVNALCARGYDAIYVKYPVYELEPTGQKLNQVLRQGGLQTMSEEELQMWFTLNRYQFEPMLKEWLSEGKIVIAEDYIGTGIAWGTVKGANTEWLASLNQYLVKSDLAILLDGDRFRSAEEKDHLHESDPELMIKSRQIHLDLAARYKWTLVPVHDGIDATAERILSLVLLQL